LPGGRVPEGEAGGPAGGTAWRLEAAGLAALALLVLALTISPITNNDLFLHLKTGEIILKTGAVPRVDDYSALARGRPFVAHEWLAGVIFRAVESGFGLDGLILLKALVALGIAATLYAAARALGATATIALPALTLVMILAAARLMERPHIFTCLLSSLYILILVRRRGGARASLWIVPPLQVLWANLHGGFMLGWMIVGLAAAGSLADDLLERLAGRRGGAGRLHTAPPVSGRRPFPEWARLAILAAALVPACLLNPYGARLLKFPFELTGSAFMQEIYEWLPPFDSAYASTYMARYYVVWATLGIAVHAAAMRILLRRGRAIPGGVFPILLFVAFLILSLRMQRNVTDFALATFPGVAASAAALLQPRAERPGRSLLPWIAAALLGLAGWYAWNGYPYGPGSRREFGLGLGRNIPVAAADYLEANAVRGNVLNTYSSGAYLVYRFHPAMRVAMDSRNDVYGEELYAEYKRALQIPESLQAMLRRIDARAIVLEWPRQGVVITAATIREMGGWIPVYFDDLAVVYVEAGGPLASMAERDGYTLLEPSLFRAGRIAAADSPRAVEEAKRAVLQSRSYVARVLLVDALLASGRRREALDEEARIVAEDPPLFFIHYHLGAIRLRLGDRREAAARFRRALALQPDSDAAHQGLESATATS
jgi:tetratricopeptide (TPR) repeat protein